MSFNSKTRDEFLSGEIFYSTEDPRRLADHWRKHYALLPECEDDAEAARRANIGYISRALSSWGI